MTHSQSLSHFCTLLVLTLCFVLIILTAPIHHAQAKVITYDMVRGSPYKVDYDERAIRINGERTILLSAGMHYPRSSPSMWPQLMEAAKAGGANTMQMYFFHNYHEVTPGIWDWESESRNMGDFIQAAADAGLFVNLRIGPYVCAEWQYGGLPFWLHDKGFPFRDYNPQWLMYMERVMTIVVDYVQPYLARNGGPIIIMQIENEFGAAGGDPQRALYIEWCGNLTQALATDTVWVMCQQPDAPPPTIYTCNGDDCSDYVYNQLTVNKKPAMWTENWVGWFEHWGEAPPTRAASNVAYTVAHFIAAGGSYQNAYMMHGGTNFGRTVGGPKITTTYDYDAALDEYGVPHEPKYSHMKNLYNIIYAYHDNIINLPFSQPLPVATNVTGYYYGILGNSGSIAFLVNIAKTISSVTFAKHNYTLAPESVQIIDGFTMLAIYDTSVYADIPYPVLPNSLPNATATAISYIDEPRKIWTMNPIKGNSPLEQISLTNYTTIYLTYATSITVTPKQAGQKSVPFLLSAANDYEHVYIDEEYVGFMPGAGDPTNFTLDLTNVQAGQRELKIVSITQGIYNGAEASLACGLQGEVIFDGLSLVQNGWLHQVGLYGEYMKYYTFDGANAASWNSGAKYNVPMIWYQLNITTPQPVGELSGATWMFDMGGCGKGELWVNEFMLGAYWSIRYTENPDIFSQRYYHMPRDYLAPPGENNMVIVYEEIGCDPKTITLMQRNATTVSYVSSM